MAKFTKSNRAIIADGTSLWDRGITQPMSDTGLDPINRITHAAPAVDDNDYIIKSQSLTIIDADLELYVVPAINDNNHSPYPNGNDNNTGADWNNAWATVEQAINYLSNKLASPTVTITINVAAGIWHSLDSTVLSIADITMDRVKIVGNPALQFDFTSIQAGTAAGAIWNDTARTYRFNTTTDPSTTVQYGDWLYFYNYEDGTATYGRPSGVTNVKSLAGAAKVSVVGSTWIEAHLFGWDGTYYDSNGDPVVTTTFIPLDNAHAPAVGNAVGRLGVLKTRFETGAEWAAGTSGATCIVIRNSKLKSIENLAIINRDHRPSSGGSGMYLDNTSCDVKNSIAHAYARGFIGGNGTTVDYNNCHAGSCLAGYMSWNQTVTSELNTTSLCCLRGVEVTSATFWFINTTITNSWIGIGVSNNSSTSSGTQSQKYISGCELGLDPSANSSMILTGSWIFNAAPNNVTHAIQSLGQINFQTGASINWLVTEPTTLTTWTYDLDATDVSNPNRTYINAITA